MASKRVISEAEAQSLREALQAATITALMASRRWQPGDLAFQGGTCLQLVHGSARFSEDLDFMIRGGLSLGGLSKEVLAGLRLPADIAKDLTVSVTSAKDKHNPHAFVVSLGGARVIGSAKVKIELWETDQAALADIKLRVKQIRTATGVQSFVPALTLNEILADKVYAVGARDRIKPRDVYDLWWIKDIEPGIELDQKSLLNRLDVYPAPSGERIDTACRWMESAHRNLQNLTSTHAPKVVALDLKRWLPSSIQMDPEIAANMIQVAVEQLRNGQRIIESIADAPTCESRQSKESPRG